MDSRRPAWPLSEAADLTGVSRSTIRRHREAGRFPNAYKDSSGAWKVPLEDLLAVGLRPTDPTITEQAAASAPDTGVNERVRDLETALAVERARADGLERAAASAESHVADLRMVLRMLESGRPEQGTEQAKAGMSAPSEQGLNTAGAGAAAGGGRESEPVGREQVGQAQNGAQSLPSERVRAGEPEQGPKRWWDRLRAR